MPVVVVVVCKHCEHLLTDKEGRFAMREFFCGLRHGGTNSPHSPQMFLVEIRPSFFRHSFQLARLVLSPAPGARGCSGSTCEAGTSRAALQHCARRPIVRVV